MSDFEQFMTQRLKAARAYCQGDGAPVAELSTAVEPASFFGPDGKLMEGAGAIRDAYVNGAKAFGPDGDCTLDVVQSAHDVTVGYWTGLQKANVFMGGKEVPMTLRITELLRKEDGVWKLVHRHADPFKGDA